MKMKVRLKKKHVFSTKGCGRQAIFVEPLSSKKSNEKFVAKSMSLQWRMPSEHLVSGSVGGMAAAPQGLVDSRDNWRTPTSVPMVLCSLGIIGKRSLQLP